MRRAPETRTRHLTILQLKDRNFRKAGERLEYTKGVS